MKLKYYILLLFCASISLSLVAQVGEKELVTEILPELLLEDAPYTLSDEVGIFQKGDFNYAEVRQISSFQSDLPNKAIVIQQGIQNELVLVQNVSNSNITATQVGTENKMTLVADGTDINMTVDQLGYNNLLIQSMTESTDMDITLRQEGSDNTLDQRFNSQNALNMTIVQKGTASKLILIHN